MQRHKTSRTASAVPDRQSSSQPLASGLSVAQGLKQPGFAHNTKSANDEETEVTDKNKAAIVTGASCRRILTSRRRDSSVVLDRSSNLR
jgi:hypothetical protein